MILIIDNTQRKLRNELRRKYMKSGIPCVVSDLEHAVEYMPCALIQVTEKYLRDDAKLLASMYGNIPVRVDDGVISGALGIVSTSHLESTETGVRFCSKRLHLTKTEKLIVNMLLMYDKGRITSEYIAVYCMVKPNVSSVRAHICNINSKAKRATGIELIDCRRFKGYRLHEFEN